MPKKPGPKPIYPSKMLASFTVETHEKLRQLAHKKRMYTTDLLREIVEQYIQTQENSSSWYDPNQ